MDSGPLSSGEHEAFDDPRKVVPRRIPKVTVPLDAMLAAGTYSARTETGKDRAQMSRDNAFRLELYKAMKEVDKDMNFYSLRPMTHEMIGFVDGKRTVSDIAQAVGYEYQVIIKPEHVLEFFRMLEQRGYLSLVKEK